MKYRTVARWPDLLWIRDAYRLLSVFRSSNTMMGRIPPEDLHWEVSWEESFVPLDMDDPPETRAARRAGTVVGVTLSCAKGPDDVGVTLPVRDVVPPTVRNFILADEHGRGSAD